MPSEYHGTAVVVARIVASVKDAHVLILGTCKYVALHGKRDLADVMKDLEMGRLSWAIQVRPMSSQG